MNPPSKVHVAVNPGYKGILLDYLGRTFETKRKMYVGKLNKQKIKAPKLETLQYYNLKFDEDSNTYSLMDWFENNLI